MKNTRNNRKVFLSAAISLISREMILRVCGVQKKRKMNSYHEQSMNKQKELSHVYAHKYS
jgi:hypothetical protein